MMLRVVFFSSFGPTRFINELRPVERAEKGGVVARHETTVPFLFLIFEDNAVAFSWKGEKKDK